MDLNEIKNLIEIDGGKFIIVENGEPTLVVSSFDDYKKKLMPKQANPASYKKEPFDTAQGRQKPIPKELETGELKLEDLPL